jgi:hypothetical protein
MPDLQPCPACSRHVTRAESSCPFCAAVIAPAAPRERPFQRMSRAAVFGAALASSACGGKHKQEATTPDPDREQEMHVQHHPCSEPDPEQVKELEKKRDDAKTDEEKQAAQRELDEAKMPVCAPYGAPPARRRVV